MYLNIFPQQNRYKLKIFNQEQTPNQNELIGLFISDFKSHYDEQGEDHV